MQPAFRPPHTDDDFRKDLQEVLSHARIADRLGAPQAGWVPELVGVMVLLTAAGLLAGTLSVNQGVAVLASLATMVVAIFAVGGRPTAHTHRSKAR